MQLKVTKADGSMEQYFHTKVIATFINALSGCCDGCFAPAEELAEMVTFYLYNKRRSTVINSNEIMSIIQATLSSTGYQGAAVNLVTHHQRRTLRRSRIEVMKIDMQKFSGSLQKKMFEENNYLSSWDKTVIVNSLKVEYNLDTVTARTIASMVEEKVLGSGLCCVPSDFVKFLVISQAKALLSAQQELVTIPKIEKTAGWAGSDTAKDGRLRQPQKGLCPVAI